MSLNRYAVRRDATERDIVSALRKVGAHVLVLDAFDLLVWYRGKLSMLDCKVPKGKATAAQEALTRAGWPLVYVETADAALKAVGALR